MNIFLPMYRLLRSFFFLLPAEKAHHFTLSLWTLALKLPLLNLLFKGSFNYEHDSLSRHIFGLSFSNPVGLAAGFDKDGKYIRQMAALGFGFVELGTVTPKPQEGNPLPRLFRLKKDKALINRMGFNNLGVDQLVSQLKELKKPEGLIIGGNIGKNKITPNTEATSDYIICFEKLFPWVDYFVVNVSSPNTPNLRALQDKEPLTALLMELQRKNQAMDSPKPILLKIAPDVTEGQLDDIIAICKETQMAGIIATNTTISRTGLQTPTTVLEEIGNGGLSGMPLKQRSTEIIRYIRERTAPDFALIGVGGISSPKDAKEKIQAGADLIQIYSGMIYEGPRLIRDIKKSLT